MTRLFRGWRPLLRIARRDALRARGRSALVVAMIALPILALTAADVLTRSAQLDPDEKVARTLGQTQARLELELERERRTAGARPRAGQHPGSRTRGEPGPDPQDEAPAGFRVLTSQEGGVEVDVGGGRRAGSVHRSAGR